MSCHSAMLTQCSLSLVSMVWARVLVGLAPLSLLASAYPYIFEVWEGRHPPSNPHFSLIGIRDTGAHLQRRKRWNRAFSTAGVKDYEPILKRRVDQLADALQSASEAGQALDLAEWISFFAYVGRHSLLHPHTNNHPSYDFMGDMALVSPRLEDLKNTHFS
jgi:hypothetical protein